MKQKIVLEDFIKCVKYPEFLKQPLEKWMFVPCDEDGNVLEEPKNEICDVIDMYSLKWSLYNDKIEQYQQAKERCLFEGLELNNEKTHLTNSFIGINVKCFKSWKNYNNYNTIEDLVKYNLQLTPTAIEQLGL